ncbi:MAG: PDZ domain-containing protein [Candidatus Kapabacteria bacterium]|nr:PDZ domain-containing protein [Candidatus Kapabacteria bacterium]
MTSKSPLALCAALLLFVHQGASQTIDAAALSSAHAVAADKCKQSVVSINVGLSKVTRKRLKHFEEHVSRLGGSIDLDALPEGSVGSGVIVSTDGYILTNDHVVDDVNEDSILVTLHDGRRFFAQIVGSDPSSDLALLRIYAQNLQAATVAKPESVRLGELVIAIGSPLGLKFTVTSGVVSAQIRDDIVDEGYSVKKYIQTDAAINPGNSGGGLFRLQGDLVGINTAILSKTGYSIGYGLALSTDLVSAVYDDLREDGKISRPSLGVSARSESLDSALAIDRHAVDETVIIDKIKSGGAADKAGLRVGDIIRSFNGMRVRTRENVTQHMALFRPGHTISVSLARNGDTLSIPVRLDTLELPFKQREHTTPRRSYIGMSLRSEGDRLLLDKIKRYGPADNAGLQDVDGIVSINGTDIKSAADLTQVVASSKPGDLLSVLCIRRGKEIRSTIVVGAQ